MKLRDMMFLVIGGLLVISGMVLNSLLSGDAEAQEGEEITRFGIITCEGLVVKNIVITDENGKARGSFGLGDGEAQLRIYGESNLQSVL